MSTSDSFNLQAWLSAARLRTLPLAIASIGLGAFLAASNGVFNLLITILAILTTVALQVLSNFANDYGDSIHGADSAERQGPARAVQSGIISPRTMQLGMMLMIFVAAVSGLLLVGTAFYQAEGAGRWRLVILFLVLGALAIWGAINYTAGKRPYGYAGMGDLAVLIFFGWLGVMGTYFLQAQTIYPALFLPATSCGLFAVAVLNVNNIRDIDSDRKAGKFSIPVRIGRQKAIGYHWLLLVLGLLMGVLYVIFSYRSPWQFLFLLTTPLLVRNGLAVANTPSSELDPYLKQMAIATLLFVVTFGIGQLI
ncbi:MAG: 1,4-dihydroxy-2-naphthoate polyprenyltransferase [Chloroflexota bacterium]